MSTTPRQWMVGETQRKHIDTIKNAENNEIVDLSGYSALLYIRNVVTQVMLIDGVAMSVNEGPTEDPNLEYQWGVGDLDTVGTYHVWYELTDGAGKVVPYQAEDMQVRYSPS